MNLSIFDAIIFYQSIIKDEKEEEITESSLDSPCTELVIFAFFGNTV